MKRWIGRTVVGAGLIWTVHSAQAQTAQREYLVKAGFIYNFAKFVTWPESALGPGDDLIYFCVVGKDPFGADLATVASKKVRGRKLTIRHTNESAELDGCQILFVSASEKRRMRAIIAATRGRPVLTVADTGDFARAGGIINLVMDGKRVRFEVNQKAAKRAGLEISSDLLSLAIVVDAEGEGDP